MKRVAKWSLWGLGIIVGVPALFVSVLLLSPHFMGGSADVEEIADRLEPSSSWVLQEEQIRPRQLGCWDGVSCPSVSRVWQSDAPLTPTEFLNFAEAIGNNIDTTETCGNTLQGCFTELRVEHDGQKFFIALGSNPTENVDLYSDPASYKGSYNLAVTVKLDD